MGLPFEQISHGPCAALIRGKARIFAMRHQLSTHDHEDLVQDLNLHALERGDRFDPTRGAPAAFLAHVVNNKLGHIREAWHAQKRDASRVRSMPPCVRRPSVRRQDVCLRMDMDAAVHSLPEPFRELAVALREHCLSDAARLVGMSRGRSRQQLVRIRQHFVKRGITGI